MLRIQKQISYKMNIDKRGCQDSRFCKDLLGVLGGILEVFLSCLCHEKLYWIQMRMSLCHWLFLRSFRSDFLSFWVTVVHSCRIVLISSTKPYLFKVQITPNFEFPYPLAINSTPKTLNTFVTWRTRATISWNRVARHIGNQVNSHHFLSRVLKDLF